MTLRRRSPLPHSSPLLAGLFAAFLGLAAAPGLAQQAPAQPAPAAPAAPAQPQRVFTPAHLAVANDVLRASGMTTMFDNAMPNVIGAIRTNFSRQRPELVKEIEEVLKGIADQQAIELVLGFNEAARMLAERFDEAELKDINTFLTSPVGKKYVGALPGFMDEVVPFLELWNRTVTAKLSNLFQQEMIKRGHRL